MSPFSGGQHEAVWRKFSAMCASKPDGPICYLLKHPQIQPAGSDPLMASLAQYSKKLQLEKKIFTLAGKTNSF
jgi:hypothetical protein